MNARPLKPNPNPRPRSRRPRVARLVSRWFQLAAGFGPTLLTHATESQGPTNALASMENLAPGGSGLLALVRVVGAFALVLAVFFAGLWVFRNWQRLAFRQGRAPKLTIRETKSLGQRHTLFVVGYQEQRWLVSTSPTGVALLTGLPSAEPEEVSEPAAQGAPSHFGVLLLQTLGRKV